MKVDDSNLMNALRRYFEERAKREDLDARNLAEKNRRAYLKSLARHDQAN